MIQFDLTGMKLLNIIQLLKHLEKQEFPKLVLQGAVEENEKIAVVIYGNTHKNN